MGKSSLAVVASTTITAIIAVLLFPAGGTAYDGVEVKNGGSIGGTIKFAGNPPAPKKLKVTKDQAVCGKEAKFSEELLVSADKGLKNAVVSLADIKQGKSLAQANFESVLDQNGCVFKPHVTLVPAGGKLKILNSDGVLHNFHTFSRKNRSINKAQPKFRKKMTAKFEQPEIVKVACDAHSWMQGWIVVAEHPYYAVTDASGKFALKDVPPGTYQLQVWHESLGKQTKEVTVKANQDVGVSIEMKK